MTDLSRISLGSGLNFARKSFAEAPRGARASCGPPSPGFQPVCSAVDLDLGRALGRARGRTYVSRTRATPQRSSDGLLDRPRSPAPRHEPRWGNRRTWGSARQAFRGRQGLLALPDRRRRLCSALLRRPKARLDAADITALMRRADLGIGELAYRTSHEQIPQADATLRQELFGTPISG
jgi:hypothetical protein